MKRYIYAFLSVLMLFAVGCDIEGLGTTEPKPFVGFCFGKVSTTTTDTTAVVEVLSYITVDGIKYDGAKVYVEYWPVYNEADIKSVKESTPVDDSGVLAFTITDLAPSTRYYANVVCDGGKKYGAQREKFMFTTQEPVDIAEGVICNPVVVAKGLVATVTLNDVAYIINDEPQQIASLKLEYALANTNSWTAVEIAGSSIKNGKATISIPKSGDSYLVENSDYTYRVTVTPSNSDYKAITTESYSFKTTYAEITATIAKPQLSHNEDGITIKSGSIAVYRDGVATTDYTTYIYFRTKGNSLWEEYTLTANNSVVIPAEQLQPNTTYEAKVSIVAGVQSQVRESEIASITTPQSEVPIVPEPPTGGDTTTIAGVWRLTSYRGAEPSFDIYMDITSTGGLTLYQRIDSRYWDVYQSSMAIDTENYIISGVYTDNVAWGSSYYISISSDTMTWTSTNDATDISIYTRSTLPTSMPTAPTRAIVPSERFL